MSLPTHLYEAKFDAVPRWAADRHSDALAAFERSAQVLVAAHPHLQSLVTEAGAVLRRTPADDAVARAFFEANFRVVASRGDAPVGFVTGYYEPVLDGARHASAQHRVPLYRRPDDLATLIDDASRGASGARHTHGRRLPDGSVVPYATRAEIEQGALDGRGLEIGYLADPVAAFFLHVQGSGVVEMAGEGRVRVGYDGKNGHPYASLGRHLIEQGEIAAAEMSLDSLASWLAADPDRGRRTMWHNPSFIFFRERPFVAAEGPLGVHDIMLTAGRSLAVDTAFQHIGLPIYVCADDLAHGGDASGFARLMIAQDVGSAITGAERGDIFFGTGSEAGHQAGITRHPARFFRLVPNGLDIKECLS